MRVEYTFKSAIVRRIPDPNFKDDGMETYTFLMRCKDVPPEIGDEPNARTTNTRKQTYKRVGESLLEQDGTDPGTFHLKNKGITIIAESVKQKRGGSEYVVEMDTGEHGIVDGGHTYALIQENKDSIPEDQYVRIDVRTGIPLPWIPMISGGLNTAVQVQSMSLENLGSSFDWVKDALGGYKTEIAWNENESGKYLDARDLTAIMCLLNPIAFPNFSDDSNETQLQHPTVSYASKEKALERFKSDPKNFKQMKPILLEALELHDYIASSAREVWNRTPQSTKAGLMKIIEHKKKGYDFPFIGKKSEYRLTKPALYPILGAFRWFVRQNSLSGDLEWVTDFPKIKKFWDEEGRGMIVIVNDTLKDLGYSLTSLGKNNNLWRILHSETFIPLHKRSLMD